MKTVRTVLFVMCILRLNVGQVYQPVQRYQQPMNQQFVYGRGTNQPLSMYQGSMPQSTYYQGNGQLPIGYNYGMNQPRYLLQTNQNGIRAVNNVYHQNTETKDDMELIKKQLKENQKQMKSFKRLLKTEKKKNRQHGVNDMLTSKKAKIRKLFDGFIGQLKQRKRIRRYDVVSSFKSFFNKDKRFYRRNFLRLFLKDYDLDPKYKLNLDVVKKRVHQKIKKINIKDRKLRGLDDLLKKKPKKVVKKQKKDDELTSLLKFENQLKKNNVDLPEGFFKNYKEMEELLAVKKYALEHKQAKKAIERKLKNIDSNYRNLDKEIKRNSMFFDEFNKNLEKKPISYQNERFERMLKNIKHNLRYLKDSDYGAFYLDFIDNYSQLGISSLEPTTGQTITLNDNLYNSIDIRGAGSFYESIHRILVDQPEFKVEEDESNHNATEGFTSFLQYIKNSIESPEKRFIVNYYFNHLQERYESITEKLFFKFPNINEEMNFDFRHFLHTLIVDYNESEFINFNLMVDELERQFSKFNEDELGQYKEFVSESSRIFLALFRNFLIVEDEDDFEQFAEFYGLDEKSYPRFNDKKDSFVKSDSSILESHTTNALIKNLDAVVNNINQEDAVSDEEELYGKIEALVSGDLDVKVKTSKQVDPAKITAIPIGDEGSEVRTDVHVSLPQNKTVKINMKTIKKGRMASRLIYEFFFENNSDENSELIDLLRDNLGKTIRPAYVKKLDYLYNTLDVYTKRFEDYVDENELDVLKEFWRVIVLFYSKDCYLKLFKKIINGVEEYKNDSDNNFEGIKKIFTNLLVFLKNDKRYNFEDDCDQLSKMIVASKTVSTNMINNFYTSHNFKKILLKTQARPESDEDDQVDEDVLNSLTGYKSTQIPHISNVRHHNVMDLVKKAIMGGKDNGAFRKKEDDSEESYPPSESNESSQQDESDQSEDEVDSNEKEKKLKFIKETIGSAYNTGTKTHISNINTKKISFNLKPKDFKYLNLLYKKYGDYNTLRGSSRFSNIKTRLHKIVYKKIQEEEKENFSHFKKELLHNFYLNQIKDKFNLGNIKTSTKLVYKVPMNKTKNKFLKFLFDRYADYDQLKDAGDEVKVYDMLNKVLYKNEPYHKATQLIFKNQVENSTGESGTGLFNSNAFSGNQLKKMRYKNDIEDEEPGNESENESSQSNNQPKKKSSQQSSEHIPSSNQNESSHEQIDEKKKCKVIKHCNKKCVKIGENGEQTELNESDEDYIKDLCDQDSESGEEWVDCDVLENQPKKQVNVNPVFDLNFQFNTNKEAKLFEAELKKSPFIQNLSKSNEIDIAEIKKALVATMNKIKYKANIMPYREGEQMAVAAMMAEKNKGPKVNIELEQVKANKNIIEDQDNILEQLSDLSSEDDEEPIIKNSKESVNSANEMLEDYSRKEITGKDYDESSIYNRKLTDKSERII